MRFSLTVYEPLDAASGNQDAPQELTRLWLDDSQTSFHVITQLGAGYYTCQVGLPSSETMGAANPEGRRTGQQLGIPAAGWLPQPVDGLRQRAHIVLQAGSFTVFEGRVTTIFPGPGGFPSGFLATGYGVSAVQDDYFTSSSTTSTTSGVALAAALAQAAPLIRIAPADRFVDPGVTVRLNDYDLQYPSQIIQTISQAGGNGTLYDFLVYERRVATFLPRTAPAVPQYHEPWSDRLQNAQELSDRMASTVALRYQDITTSAYAIESQSSDSFFAENGFARTEFIQGGQMTSGQASAYVMALLDLFARPEFSAQLVIPGAPLRDDAPLPSQAGIQRWGGQIVPPWLVRSGEWIQLVEDASTQANVRGAGPHIIQRTEWISNGQTTITIGTAIQDWVQVLKTIGDHVQALRAKIDPNTGGSAAN